MTNQELNRAIAEIKGLDVEITGTEKVCTLFITNHKGRHPAHRIDYITDWNLLGPLVIELLGADWMPRDAGNSEFEWVSYRSASYNIKVVLDKDFGTATCLAYIKEFGGE